MNGTKRIAILGLGIMGTGIAQNFLKNDQTVIVWNRSVEKTKDFKKDTTSIRNEKLDEKLLCTQR